MSQTTRNSSNTTATPASSGNPPTAQVFIRDGFQWDAQNAYLFDIDGTLLRSRDRIHYDSFRSSVLQIMGIDLKLEGVVLHGSTDPAILRDAFRNAGLSEEEWRPMLKPILDLMRQTVADGRDRMNLITMPAVEATLRHLDSKGALLGLATGNLESIGWLKTEVIGIREWFTFGGFSDEFEVRSEMIAHAASEARRMAGHDASVCVVGDTPADIIAAQANSLPTIAVCTGNYSFEQLMPYRPEVCCTSLEYLLRQTATQAEATAQVER